MSAFSRAEDQYYNYNRWGTCDCGCDCDECLDNPCKCDDCTARGEDDDD